MNFSCDKCQRRYSIADEKVRGKTVKVRCKNCQNVISVQGPPQEQEESTRVVSLADVERLREQERSLAASQSAAPAASEGPWGEEEPTRAAPGRPSNAQWFVMVKSKQEGPLDEAGLSALVAGGTVSARSFFWQQGMADWKRGSDVPELAELFAPPPEPAPRPPTPAPLLSSEPVTTQARGARGGAASRAQPEPQADPPWEEAPAPADPDGGRAPWDLDPPTDAEPVRGRSAPEPEPEPQDQAPWDDAPAAESSQDWNEPAPQQEQPWNDEAEQPTAPQRKDAGMGDLFSDLDLPLKGDGDETGPYPPEGTQDADPLAGVPGGPGKDGKPVEDTRHFMVQSGVTRRNPIWKVALFILVPLALVVGGVFAADRLNFVPKVKVVNAKGETVEKSLFFSGEGVSELRDRLMGRKPQTAPVPAVPPAEKKSTGAQKPEGGAPSPSNPETGKAAVGLEAIIADSEKEDEGPSVREDAAAQGAGGPSGPSQDEVKRVVDSSQGAIQGCVERELRKNPAFRGGKVLLTATVGTSGTVKKASLDRKELDKSPVGDCIKKSAKRMVFPPFEAGEDVDLEIPLVLSSGAM